MRTISRGWLFVLLGIMCVVEVGGSVTFAMAQNAPTVHVLVSRSNETPFSEASRPPDYWSPQDPFSYWQAPGTFTVSQAAASSTWDFVYYRLTGTAVIGKDYWLQHYNGAINTSATVDNFTPNEGALGRDYHFRILPINDSVYKGPRTVTFTLIESQFPSWPGYTIDEPRSVTFTITDDDAPADPIPARVDRFGMTRAQYKTELDTWAARGLRLTHVSAYDVAGDPRFAAVWEQESGPAWVERHDLTATQYQNESNTWAKLGYRLVAIDGYETTGEARYAALWKQTTGAAVVARLGLTAAAYQSDFNTMVGQGYRLRRVDGYHVGQSAYYAAVWEKATGPTWMARHGMTSSEYQTEFNNAIAGGYRLTHVSGYEVGGTDYYAAIWEAAATTRWTARHDMTLAEYHQELSAYIAQGFRLAVVSAYNVAGKDYYAALWEASRR